ncbi:DUF2147 domain-containing protein [Sphingosinithalassobacter sp. CS137]|uniref:DUF2147 domain-containing protein n=1 Tax=Sphingosinithalassobacter sp. CS137 TaxID=2762748 RepID=UPI00165D6805|nr:DUF2147 domain-containing protein [Sphingosinithalassobacter sp. CS137]
MKPIRTFAGACALALPLLFPAAVAGQSAGEVPEAVWSNPDGSVHIRSYSCDGKLCGRVTWANEEAKRDAREGGTESLVGTNLFRNFTQQPSGAWEGEVFVPDLGKRFSGTIRFEGDTLSAEGCAALGIICKSQRWTRVE